MVAADSMALGQIDVFIVAAIRLYREGLRLALERTTHIRGHCCIWAKGMADESPSGVSAQSRPVRTSQSGPSRGPFGSFWDLSGGRGDS
jgi:hypothetical protein